jgi:drug/metabolite transporter (DMT)-like permease
MNSHLKAVLQALFVVFLWATSWVFIKVGLEEIPPLTFAGLRYLIAFLCLLGVFFFNEEVRKGSKMLSKEVWVRLSILGLLFYAITQGASFVALAYLPAVTVNLLWSCSSVTVALLGVFWLSERPRLFQWGGVALAILGSLIYFLPVDIPKNQTLGLMAAVFGVLANALSSIMGREINRTREYHSLQVTVVSMGIGAILLLVTGLCVEGLPAINLKSWSIILWLAIVNTAFAFTLWNHTLRTLTAMESSIINGTMSIWIPVFAILFLGENITGKELFGLIGVGIGTLMVQIRRTAKL